MNNHDKKVEELFNVYFGDNSLECSKCGATVYAFTIPLLGETVRGLNDGRPIYAPVTYYYNTPHMSSDSHLCLRPHIFGSDRIIREGNDRTRPQKRNV